MESWMQGRRQGRRTARKMTLWCAALVLGCMVTVSASATAPTGRYTVTQDTVLDNVTKLTWQRVHHWKTYSLKDAKTYCSTLPLDKGGWRLPTLKELLTLVDRSVTNPAIDSAAFPNTKSYLFWSTNLYAPKSGNAWYVDFFWGNTNFLTVSTVLQVRCVR